MIKGRTRRLFVAAAMIAEAFCCLPQSQAQSQTPGPASSQTVTSPQAERANTSDGLDAILQKARLQLARYTTLLPNVIGMEQGDSRWYDGQKLKREVHFTAHIRMTHRPLPKFLDRVTEEAKFLTENGKPVSKTPKNIPLYLTDVFTNQNPSILPVSVHCVSYKLLPSGPGSILIERWIHPLTLADTHFCKDANLGEITRITLDAQTMQMIHIERPVQPRKDLKPGMEIGFMYDYAPQKMGEETALLPLRIHAELVSEDQKWHKVFDASYSDYQRYGSTATMLPASAP